MSTAKEPVTEIVTETVTAQSIEEVVEAVQAHASLVPTGGGTKPALSAPRDGAVRLELHKLTGILEYAPAEYTFTARAGTTLGEVQDALAENGQYLPFDPPLVKAGATLGGTIAAGLSGSGRYRFGGVRDFLLGVRLVDGQGRVTMGGGKVVKNAAGFDLPKLLVGSLGQLGIMTEVTFKVFPAPRAYTTLKLPVPNIDEAVGVLQQLSLAPYDIEALDIGTLGDDYHIWLRLGGLPAALPARIERIQNLVGGGEVIAEVQEPDYWIENGEFGWTPAGTILAKVPVTPGRIPALDAVLMAHGAERRYSVAGNIAWLAFPDDAAALDSALKEQGLTGLILRGNPVDSSPGPIIGSHSPSAFARRVKHALDPDNKFLPLF